MLLFQVGELSLVPPAELSRCKQTGQTRSLRRWRMLARRQSDRQQQYFVRQQYLDFLGANLISKG